MRGRTEKSGAGADRSVPKKGPSLRRRFRVDFESLLVDDHMMVVPADCDEIVRRMAPTLGVCQEVVGLEPGT